MPSVYILIPDPLPPGFPLSYGSFKYGKFGIGCWFYQRSSIYGTTYWDGEMEWINTQNFRSDSKLSNPYGFRFWLYPNLIATSFMEPTPVDPQPDMIVGGSLINLLTGKGLPFKIPY